jgi:uncharacterized membrane protein
MKENFFFAFRQIKDKLWFRPVIFCLVSILGALIAQVADSTNLHDLVPEIKTESVTGLLNIISSSMLVIATFTVGSMLSAFSAASSTATPRSFNLIITDDVSRNSLSAFIGSFIFSIVALVAVNNGYYGKAGLFTLFVLTMMFFSIVILTFLRWVERISRLGRMGHTIKLIEDVTQKSIINRLKAPTIQGLKTYKPIHKETPVYCDETGYVTTINMASLQEIAEKIDAILIINAIPGKFVSIDQPLLFIHSNKLENTETIDYQELKKHFTIDDMRDFENDPRFGIITLSEIASRALSPAVNDPGTAIQIINSHVRLFTLYNTTEYAQESKKVIYDRIVVPELQIKDLFEDAFRPIARDGAGNIEVMTRLQKAFNTISKINHSDMQANAVDHSFQSYSRTEKVMTHQADLLALRNESIFIKES